jgi:hypothetical protein
MGKMVINPTIWSKLQKSESAYTKNLASVNNGSNVIIPNYIKFISDNVYRGSTKLHTIVLSERCFIIGTSAFENSFVKNISFPKSLQAIKKKAFFNTKIRDVEIPPLVKVIETKAFRECHKLNSVKFDPECLCNVIQEEVFYNCSSLQSVTLPAELGRIESRAFYRCKMLEQVNFPSTLKHIGSEAFYFTQLSKLELPIGLIEIGDSAFFKCNLLTEVKIPFTVKKLGKWVFHGCNRLKVIEILHDPEYIGDWLVNKSVTVRCKKDSYVDHYCEKFGFRRNYV